MRRYYFTWVTSAHHVVHSSHAKLRDDRQAEDFARDILSAADPSILAIQAWETSRLVCRVQREIETKQNEWKDRLHIRTFGLNEN